ncbi:universal stress protein [Massilia sp. CF038]|uniref:universal stress protein n=1 Tax=Massilia sp. CF038 TaxID=1881045 RepID=UPI0009136FF5|nr:universal stress protein [Massilia sp. CF038]SHH07189.1 Nucleotide-binding universal stress protein, UspA family [Massilia sp. CF038]
MAYRTLLVHVDGSAHAAARIAFAMRLARDCGAHLSGAAPTGISRHLYQRLPPEQDDPTLALHLDMMRDQARTALAAFVSQCEAAQLGEFDARLIDDDQAEGMCLHARAADLAIVGQSDPEWPALADLAPHVIVHSGRPVLVVPPAPAAACDHILVAWDGGREAARALQLALPLLRQARQVKIVLVESASNPQAVADAMIADPRPWLQRHGIDAQLTVQPLAHHRLLSRKNDVGESLLAKAAAEKADLLVMGAYGHSRFREAMLGGVTRTVLEAATLPVLMVH